MCNTYLAAGSHCLVEWVEPGAPCSVVPMKQVKPNKGDVTIGEICKVGFRQGVKMSYYDAKILGIGRLCLVYRIVCYHLHIQTVTRDLPVFFI